MIKVTDTLPRKAHVNVSTDHFKHFYSIQQTEQLQTMYANVLEDSSMKCKNIYIYIKRRTSLHFTSFFSKHKVLQVDF